MKRIFFSFFAFAAALVSCSKADNPGGNDPSIDPSGLPVVKDCSTEYVVVYSDDNSNNAKQLANAFSSELSATVKTAASSASPSDCEILIGATGREESSRLAELVGSEGYAVKVYGRKIAILGTDEGMTALAMFHFQDKILKNKEFSNGKSFSIPADYSFVAKNPAPATFQDALKNGYTFVVETKLIGVCPARGDCYVSQGAASDGTYVWFVLRDNTDTKAVICQYTLSPFLEVGVGNVFNGGHCNDLTYDDAGRRLVLAHGQDQGKTLTIIDPVSLNSLRDVSITAGSGAITYNKSRNLFAISQGGNTLIFMDQSLSVLKSHNRTDGMTSTYVAQGMGSDDQYIYFPMSPSSGKSTDNILAVYDWNAKYIDNIHIPLSMESESMFCVNGRYYVNFYNSRSAKLYQIIPSLRYRYRK